MQSAAEDVFDIIHDSSELPTLVSGTSLFISDEPDEGTFDLVRATLYDTGGPAQNPKLAIDESSVMVRVRSAAGYAVGHRTASAVKRVLEGIGGRTLAQNTKLVGIWVTSNIAFVRRDESNRPEFTFNLRVVREPTGTNLGHRMAV